MVILIDILDYFICFIYFIHNSIKEQFFFFFGKYVYYLSFRRLDEKIYTTLLSIH